MLLAGLGLTRGKLAGALTGVFARRKLDEGAVKIDGVVIRLSAKGFGAIEVLDGYRIRAGTAPGAPGFGIDPVHGGQNGRIPGARNLPFTDVLFLNEIEAARATGRAVERFAQANHDHLALNTKASDITGTMAAMSRALMPGCCAHRPAAQPASTSLGQCTPR